jgi:ABC-type nitrate/sulfonate/bicarbonate transport system ATPase subunit
MSVENVIEIQDLSKRFGGFTIFDGLSLKVRRGEFVAIMGESGCGKTTLLNLLAGYDTEFKGSLNVHGRVRTVFQADGLFPWQTVAGNILFGAREQEPSLQKQRLRELLSLFRLEPYREHYPHQLSGGTRQRTELARALASDTEVLLLDEPFSGADALTRLKLRTELQSILDKMPRTVVLVTHDIEEALQLADRILILSSHPARVRREFQLSQDLDRDAAESSARNLLREIWKEFGLFEGAER